MSLRAVLRRASAGLLAAAMLLLGGCRTLDIFSVDSLIRPPKLTGENARIQQAFEQAVGRDVVLVNPLLGEYRSAFVFCDFDQDSAEETVVFYAKNDAPSEIRMHLMDHDGENWYSVGDVAGNGSEVYRVEFCNIDADPSPEIAVTWTVSDSKRNKTLAVYKIDLKNAESSVYPLSVLQVLDYLILDFDFDGRREILYLYSDTSVQSQLIKAALIKLDPAQQSFVPVSDVELSRNVEYPVSCVYDLQDGRYRVYFDCINFDDTYITEILVFDPESSALVRPLDGAGEYLCLKTVRTEALLTENAYGGYRMDIPVCYPYAGSVIYDSDNDISSQLYITQFMDLEDGAFSPASSAFFYDSADGFRIRLDDYLEEYLIVYKTVERALLFYRREAPDTLVFSINFRVGDPAKERCRIVIFQPSDDGRIQVKRIQSNVIPM